MARRIRSRLSRTLLEKNGQPVYLVPCTIVQVSPELLVDMLGGTNLPAIKADGCTYTIGAAANAYVTTAGLPQVLPIPA